MKFNVKKGKRLNTLNLSVLFIFTFCLVFNAEAVTIKNKQVGQAASAKFSEIQDQVIFEAAQAIELTERALGQLQKQNYKKAISTLESALGKTEVINADDLKNGNILIDFRMMTFDFDKDNQFIKDERSRALSKLMKGKIQEAKRILDPLASEIVIESYHLALSNYPSYIKDSIKAIKEKEYDTANISIISALSSVEIKEEVIPLPILRAYSIIDSLETNIKSSKLDIKDAIKKLKLAKDQLFRAELLGYGSSLTDFIDLNNKINLAENKIKSNQKPQKLLAKLRSLLTKLKNKVVN